jgi:hypothetical protein
MTYPPQGPQGPYGQQPDPYGQQQSDPYGQQQQPQYGGGYQQQPPTGQFGAYDPNAQQGQYGAYDPNAQYGGGYPQYGGVGGPPPKKNKGPIIAIVSIVVLLLAGLGITGFVAPGFFLSDKDDSAGGGGGGSSTANAPSGADAVIAQLVAAADDQNKSKLKDLTCSDAEEVVDAAIESIDETEGAELKDTEEQGSDTVVATLSITVDGDTDDYDATVKKDGKDWCWQDISDGTGSTGGSSSSSEEPSTTDSEPGGGGTTVDSDGAAFIQSFLDKLATNDPEGVKAMLCSDATQTAQQTSADIATRQSELKLDDDAAVSTTSVSGNVVGTLDGKEASGVTSAFIENDNWCIYTFFVA